MSTSRVLQARRHLLAVGQQLRHLHRGHVKLHVVVRARLAPVLFVLRLGLGFRSLSAARSASRAPRN